MAASLACMQKQRVGLSELHDMMRMIPLDSSRNKCCLIFSYYMMNLLSHEVWTDDGWKLLNEPITFPSFNFTMANMCPSKRKPTLQVKSYYWDN